METSSYDRFGDVALRHRPRALASGDRDRVRVAVRDLPATDELPRLFGPELRTTARGDETELEFDAARLDVAANSSLPLARAIAAAALARRAPPARPRILGVLNVTPDSFSDGGEHADPARAIERGLAMVAEGADLIDVGGESTRPGAEPVGVEEELRRVLPVVRGLALRTGAAISIDTTKARVAAEALDAGASIVNDVSAGRFDPEMIPLVSVRGAGLVLMHMLGTPRDMQTAPRYGDVVAEVLEFLRERAAVCLEAGIPEGRLWVDPGIGFGKRLEHNLALLARLAELRSLGLAVLVGPSRKSFLAAVCEQDARAAGRAPAPPHERVGGTAAAVALAVFGGAEILRVHDVRIMAEAARVARAIADA